MPVGAVILRLLRDFPRSNYPHLREVSNSKRFLLLNQVCASAAGPKVGARSLSDQPQAEGEVEEPKEAENLEPKEFDPKDRSVKIPVSTSIRYLQSKAYFTTYGTEPVWVPYRRNFKGQFQPRLTRKYCIKDNRIVSGNPCPICRDEYLVLHETNVELLKQFISPYNGEVLSWMKTGICQKQFDNLMVAILKARDLGLLTYHVPYRHYDYSKYEPCGH